MDICNKLVFVSGKPFQLSLKFVGDIPNIRVDWKGLQRQTPSLIIKIRKLRP